MGIRYAILLSLVLGCLGSAQDIESSDARERARAARELGKQGSEAIPSLQKLLSDREYEVRLEAVKAIAGIGTRHSLEPLIQATRDNDPEIQVWATDGLVNFYYPGYLQTGITASLKRIGTSIKGRFTDVNDQVIDPFVEVRGDVIDALGKLARGGASMDVRANAARAAGVLRGKQAIPDLLEALRSKDSQVIYEVLRALQKIRDPSAAPGIAFLLRDFEEKIQIAALETTGLLQNKEALPRLYDALRRTRSKNVQRAALTAIAMMPDEQSRPLYAQHIRDRDEDIRAAAAEGFARLRNPEDTPMLEKLFEEERKRSPRLSLAFALVMLGKTEVSEFSPLQYLINMLNSRSYRGVAQPFLIELSRESAVRQALYQALPRGTKDEKIMLAQVLARSGDQETVRHLETLSKDSETEVAQEGLRALRTLKARLQ